MFPASGLGFSRVETDIHDDTAIVICDRPNVVVDGHGAIVRIGEEQILVTRTLTPGVLDRVDFVFGNRLRHRFFGEINSAQVHEHTISTNAATVQSRRNRQYTRSSLEWKPEMNSGPASRRPVRLLRSMLFVPATSERFFSKALSSDADGIIFDLEDAVAEGQKESARKLLVTALNDLDFGAKTVAVRINGIETPQMYKDVISLAEQCPRLDLIVQPMVEYAWHVQCVATLLDQIQRSTGNQRMIGIEAIIETPMGLENVGEMARVSSRLEALSFGAGDYAAAMRMKNHIVGAPDSSYRIRPSVEFGESGSADQFGDKWHYAMARVANAGRAYGLRVRDSAYADFKNQEGFRAAAVRARALGFEGKSAIHPSQISVCNEVFSPSPEELAWATSVVGELERAARLGNGAVGLNGEMVDEAHVKLARSILEEQKLVTQNSPANGTRVS